MKRGALLICLVAIATASEAQMIRVGLSVDSLAAGQVFEYRLLAEFGTTYTRVLPPDSTAWGDTFEFRSMRRVPVSAGRDSLIFKLQFFGSKDTVIVPKRIRFVGPDTLDLLTPTVPVLFKTLLTPDATELQPLKPIYEFAMAWWPWVAGGLVLTGLLYVLYRRYRNRQVAPEPEPVAVSRPPYVNPLDTLRIGIETLRRRQDLQEGNFKSWYSDLGDLLRQYVEDVHGIPAMESTTGELRSAFRQRGLPGDLAQPMLRILDEADMVKFAKFRPDPQSAEAAHRSARDFCEAAERLDQTRLRHLEQIHMGGDDPS